MNRTSNKTNKAKPTTQIKYEYSPVETTTHPFKLHHQGNHDSPHSDFYRNLSTTENGKHSDSLRLKESDYGNSNFNNHDDNNSKSKYQGAYTKSHSEDPTRSPLHGNQSFSKSYLQGKRGDSSGKGKLFTQPFVPRTQNGHHRHHAPGQQPFYSSPDTKYISTSPILTVAHSPGSIHAQHSYGIQQSHYHHPQTTNPASPRSIHPQLSPPVPSAPIPIPHSWSAPGMPQYYAVPSSMYDPQQIQYHYYTPYQPAQPHSSVYSYLPSLTPPLPPFQASPPSVQQKSPSASYHVSPSRSSKAIPIINPNTMAPVQTDIQSTSQGSKENEPRHGTTKTDVVPSIQFIDPAIKEQEEREQQEQQEKEQQRLEEEQKQKEPVPDDCVMDPVITDIQQEVEATEITSTSSLAPQDQPGSPDIIQYDPAFLMQFMPLCLETAEDLSSFQNIIEPSVSCDKRQPQNFNSGLLDKPMFRSSSNNNNYSRSAPNGIGRTEMGKFIGGRTLTGRTTTINNNNNTAIDTKMQRDDSSGGRSRGGISGRVAKQHHRYEHQGAATIPYDQVAPLEKSANRWVPSILTTTPTATTTDLLSQEEITRKVKALLNKLTLEKFETISDKIIGYAKQSIQETDGQSLRTVIQLIFEKACDEAAFASMWAQLCRKLYEWIPADIKDVNTKDKNDDIMSGIPLYCKYLLSRCQYEFEKGWKSIPDEDGLTEEYYQAVKIKRQGLGLVQFIGELYRRDMLSQRIMYQCLKRLCDHGSEAHEEEVESLCKLLTTIGADIERNPQTAPWIDVFFKRMKNEMYSSANLSSRVKFMILDVFDLRKNHWVPRNGSQDGPKTIAQIHEEAEKAKLLEKEASAKRSVRGQPYSNNRQGTFRNAGKPIKRGTWNAGSSPPRHELTDYSNFGRTERSRSRTNVLGPSNNPFPSLNRSGSTPKTQPIKPTLTHHKESTISNMYSALGHESSDEPTKSAHKSLDCMQLKRRIKNTLAEYYEMADMDELFTSIKELDQPETQPALALELVGVIEGHEKQVRAVGDLIPKLYQAHLLDRHVLVKTFQEVLIGYDDLVIDVPQAPTHLARLLIQAGIGLAEINAAPSLQHAYAALHPVF